MYIYILNNFKNCQYIKTSLKKPQNIAIAIYKRTLKQIQITCVFNRIAYILLKTIFKKKCLTDRGIKS